VLRGPQGTLFGAGAEGGAVRYIMTPASTTAADTYVRSDLSYTQYGQPNARVRYRGGHPVVEGVFGLRGSIWYRYDGGWMNRVDPGTARSSTTTSTIRTPTWRACGHVATERERHRYAQHPLPEAGQARRGYYWPAYSSLGQGHSTPRTPERVGGPGYLLPAGAQGGLEPRQEPADR